MSRKSDSLLGGLLAGIGQGILLKGRNEREDFETRQKEARQFIRDQRELALRSASRFREEEARRKHQGGLLQFTDYDAENNAIGITGTGVTKQLGYKGQPSAATSASVSEKYKMWDAAIDVNTEDHGAVKGVTIKWNKIAEAMDAQGYPDMAALARSSFKGKGSGAIDYSSAEWKAAKAVVDEERQSKEPMGPNWMQPGHMKREFGDDTPEVWANKETERRMREGNAGAAPGAGATTGAAAPSALEGTKRLDFKTPEEAGEAFRMGLITQPELEFILTDSFGIENDLATLNPYHSAAS